MSELKFRGTIEIAVFVKNQIDKYHGRFTTRTELVKIISELLAIPENRYMIFKEADLKASFKKKLGKARLKTLKSILQELNLEKEEE